jgi:nucleoside-triphosphatase
MAEVLVLTGRPGVGKTTLIRRLADALGSRAGGFYTEEIRQGGRRVGFRLVTLDGEQAVLAHVGWRDRPHRVGRYGVDIAVVDRMGTGAIQRAVASGRVVLVDEVGKMELLSTRFREAVEDALRGPSPIVATLLASPHPWADALRRRPGVTELVLTPANRDQVLADARAWIARRLAGDPPLRKTDPS